MSNRNFDPNNPYSAPMPPLPGEAGYNQAGPDYNNDDLIRQLTRSSTSPYDVQSQPAQPAYAAPQPVHTASGCPECGGNMLIANTHSNSEYQFYFTPPDKGFFDFRRSEVRVLVCENCGFTKFYALSPSELRPKE